MGHLDNGSAMLLTALMLYFLGLALVEYIRMRNEDRREEREEANRNPPEKGKPLRKV